MDIPFEHKLTSRYCRHKYKSTITGYCYEPSICNHSTSPIFFRIDYTDKSVETEYKILSQLQEYDFVPKIISVTNIGPHKALFTECIDGVSLDNVKIDDPKWVKGITGALSLLHTLYKEKGFLHRDISDNNIMIDKDDKVYIIDFESGVIDPNKTWINDLMGFVEDVIEILYRTNGIASEKLEDFYNELDTLSFTKCTDPDVYGEYITKFKNILFFPTE